MFENIQEGLKDAYDEMISAEQGFENAVDQELIDYFTLKIAACQKRYQYYLKKAREAGINGISSK